MTASKPSGKFSIVLDAKYREELEKIALACQKTWGERGNITGLFEAIAEREFVVVRSSQADWRKLLKVARTAGYKTREEFLSSIANQKVLIQPSHHAQSLVSAFWCLRESGQFAAAESIADILLSGATIGESLRQQIQALKSAQWYRAIEKLQNAIASQKAFELQYLSKGQLKIYTVVHARIMSISGERHQYLVAKIHSDAAGDELPELKNNRSFRLDRIIESDFAISPSTARWEKDLDWLSVKFKLTGGLASNYDPRPEDAIELTEDGKIVTRPIWSSFWFVREIVRYGSSCTLLNPEPLRLKVVEELKKTLSNY